MAQFNIQDLVSDIKRTNKNVVDRDTFSKINNYMASCHVTGDDLIYYVLNQYMKSNKKGTASNAYKKGINKEDIMQLRQKGHTLKEIAAMYGVTERTIRNRITNKV